MLYSSTSSTVVPFVLFLLPTECTITCTVVSCKAPSDYIISHVFYCSYHYPPGSTHKYSEYFLWLIHGRNMTLEQYRTVVLLLFFECCIYFKIIFLNKIFCFASAKNDTMCVQGTSTSSNGKVPASAQSRRYQSTNLMCLYTSFFRRSLPILRRM
jgi:hypothetical protein